MNDRFALVSGLSCMELLKGGFRPEAVVAIPCENDQDLPDFTCRVAFGIIFNMTQVIEALPAQA